MKKKKTVGYKGKRSRNKKKPLSKKKKRILELLVSGVVLIAAIFAVSLAVRCSALPDTSDDDLGYPVRGIDVSSYQGSIDWDTLADQGIAFAFIKATEGSSHVDKNFEYNWENAGKTDLRIGAYHFLSFDSSGEAQAENFISAVQKTRDMLPPVIDIEMYGRYSYDPPDAETVHTIINDFAEKIEAEYGMKPVIYTTPAIYEKYISSWYDYDLWCSDLEMEQPLSDGTEWTFCQYSFSGRLEGHSGNIDLDVYKGSKLSWLLY